MDPFTPLFGILRDGREHVKVALECTVPAQGHRGTAASACAEQPPHDSNVQGHNLDASSQQRKTSSSYDPFAKRRILAVVTNVERGYEEACIFVLKRRRKDAHSVKIVDGFPIVPSIKVASSVAQAPGVDVGGAETEGDSIQQIDITLAGRVVSGLSSDGQAVEDFVKVVREASERSQQVPTNTDADEDALSANRAAQASKTTAAQQQVPPSHAWLSHYLDTHQSAAAAAAAATPIFSRFTTSSIEPPRADRPSAPSPTSADVKVAMGTWNVNGSAPPPGTSLASWLHIVEDDPDIVVVGLEEADSSGLSYVVWTPHVEAAWTQTIETAMGRKAHEYEKLASRQLVGILTLVYVKRAVHPRISMLSHAAMGVGFGGWAANKGAVALRFELDEMTFCFVVSHLSAFEGAEARERRRWDYHEIVRRLRLPLVMPSDAASVAAEGLSTSSSSSSDGSSSEEEIQQSAGKNEKTSKHGLHRTHLPRNVQRKLTAHFGPAADIEKDTPHAFRSSDAESMLRSQLEQAASREAEMSTTRSDAQPGQNAAVTSPQHVRVLDHDVVFWAGDLNFRLELSRSEVKRLIPRQQYENTLLKFDQLRSEMEARAAFDGFQEQRIL